MFKIHLITSIRNLKRSFPLSLIYVSGLAIGFTCVFFLSIWVNNELEYDRSFTKVNRMYKVYLEEEINGQENKHPWVSFPLAEALRNDIPEVESSVIINSGSIKVKYNDQIFYEKRTCFTEPEISKVFDFETIRGNNENALKKKESVVINDKTAIKYFGNEDPIGKTLVINDEYLFEVTAVVKSLQKNSSINYDLFILAKYFSDPLSFNNTNWGALNFNCYLILKENANPDEVRNKIKDLHLKYQPEVKRSVNIQPIKKSHLYAVDGKPTNIKNIRIMITLGFVIWLVALINYLNIIIGQYYKREKGFRTRNILGSNNKYLLGQILTESSFVILLSSVFSVFLSSMVFPLGKRLTEIDFPSNLVLDKYSLLVYSCLFIGTLIICVPVIYFYTKGIKHINCQKSSLTGTRKTYNSMFIIFQYAASVFLVISVIVVIKQLNFITEMEIGIDTANVITLPLQGNDRKSYPTLKMELLKNNHVKNVSAGYNCPTQIRTSCNIIAWPGNPYQEKLGLNYTVVDEDYFATLNIPIVQGVPFSKKPKSDSVAYILNESAVKKMNLSDPIGAIIDFSCWQPGKVVGVAKDFHFQSMYSKIEPLVIAHHLFGAQNILIKLNNNPDDQALSSIESVWSQVNPESPFNYQLLDHTIESMYKKDRRFKNLLISCSIIASIITSIGILGIILLQTQKRTKEIGIRKVNGAKATELIALLNKDMLRWIIIAFLISSPIARYVMLRWLNNFAYKTTLNWWIFALAGAIALFIAVLTVSWHSWRAATRNPVEALRYE